MSRSKRTQSKHDTEVQAIAKKLEKQGYNVQADVPGFQQPKTIGGYRPDVIAKKGNQRKIVEVETPDSAKSTRDLNQQKAFQQAANRSQNTTFKRTIAD